MLNTTFNLNRDFPSTYLQKILERIEMGGHFENPSTSLSPSAGNQSIQIGWGRILNPISKKDHISGDRSGTFGTCDILRSFNGLQQLCDMPHYRMCRVAPSSLLHQRCREAYRSLKEKINTYIEIINCGSKAPVSAPKFSKVLCAISQYMRGDEKILWNAIDALEKTRAMQHDGTLGFRGWRWYLDSDWGAFSPSIGPTALLIESLISVEKALIQIGPWDKLSQLSSLIDSSVESLCWQFKTGVKHEPEERILCLFALDAYSIRPSKTSEPILRHAGLIRTQQLIELENVLSALITPGLEQLTLKCRDHVATRPHLSPDRLKDISFDIFLLEPLIPAFHTSANPPHRELACRALRQTLSILFDQLDRNQPISTHWLGSIVDVIMSIDTPIHEQSKYKNYCRFITVPDKQMSFFLLSDTQFGDDSTSNRPPLPGSSDTYQEIQAAAFPQLVTEAALRLTENSSLNNWTGLIHLGDVVSRANFSLQESVAIKALHDSANILKTPINNIVISPGNHDQIRPGLLSYIKQHQTSTNPKNWTIESFVDTSNQYFFRPTSTELGFTSFKEMYSRVIGRHVNISEGGVEIISFRAPRITVHMINLWPLIRYKIKHDSLASKKRNKEQNEVYGISSKAMQEVREFLEELSSPSDIVILLSHIPCQYVTQWTTDDSNRHSWIGPPVAESLTKFLSHVTFKSEKLGQKPQIHLILSGHMQTTPKLRPHGNETLNYVSGAFHLKSKISSGSYAAKLSIDEGAIRIDQVALNTTRKPSQGNVGQLQEPIILAIGKTSIDAASYHAHVLDTYDAEADYFISQTYVDTKYTKLEIARDRFLDLLQKRFPKEEIHVLDIGAGAGRDTKFFLTQGCRVTALEGSPRLAKHLEKLKVIEQKIKIHQINFLDQESMTATLSNQSFHGVWMCATLLHVPSIDDLRTGTEVNFLHDIKLLKLIRTHLIQNGIFYLDNKLGQGAHFKERGNVYAKRWFKYRKTDELVDLISRADLSKIETGWHNAINGVDAWIWAFSEPNKSNASI